MQIDEMTFEAPLGSWHVAQAGAPRDLAGEVQAFWQARGHVSFSYEKLVPRGSADLIFNLSGPQRMYADGERVGHRTYQRVWLSGLFDRPLFVGPAYDAETIGTHLVAVQIHPSAIYSLFGLAAFELRNRVIEADEIFGSSINRIWNQLGNVKTTAERFAVLEQFVRQCKNRLARPAPFAALWAMQQTVASGGSVRVQRLCDELGMSRKHLAALFRRTVGLNPKSYARLSRFRLTMERINAPGCLDFSDLAFELGYSDQAHLIREFRRFSGDSPLQFLNERCADGESIIYE